MNVRFTTGRDSWLSALIAALTIGAVAWILEPQLSGVWNAREARRELVALTSRFELGLSQANVRARLAAASPQLLTATDVGGSLTLVATPYTFGAGNWVAWLDFDQGRLTSVRVRIADGERFKPAGSPPDVGVPPLRRR